MENKLWMSNISQRCSELPLNMIAIPGSHDSFTSQIEPISTIGPDVRPAALKLMNYSGYYGKCLMSPWLITQNITATQQLLSGIRYFDIRIGNNGKKLCVTHQLFSGPIDQYLLEINQFLIDYPREIVLLDFNHIYLDEEYHIILMALIRKIFGSKIASSSDYNNSIPSLVDLWDRQHQLLVFYHSDIVSFSDFWASEIIPTFWPNTTDNTMMIAYLNNSLKYKEKDKFHISQGILTPNSKTILFHPFSCLQHHLADKATATVSSWLSSGLSGSDKSVINIVISDFVQEHNFIDSVLKLNNEK